MWDGNAAIVTWLRRQTHRSTLSHFLNPFLTPPVLKLTLCCLCVMAVRLRGSRTSAGWKQAGLWDGSDHLQTARREGVFSTDLHGPHGQKCTVSLWAIYSHQVYKCCQFAHLQKICIGKKIYRFYPEGQAKLLLFSQKKINFPNACSQPWTCFLGCMDLEKGWRLGLQLHLGSNHQIVPVCGCSCCSPLLQGTQRTQFTHLGAWQIMEP